jgi:two-component system cell cycle sensor histidine kinase/response regulator CckA
VSFATVHSVLWWELGLAGAALLNVIEGGKKKREVAPQRRLALASVLEALPEAVFLLDDSRHIVNINQSAEKLMERSRDLLLGHIAASMLQHQFESENDLDALLTRAYAGEPARSGQLIFRCLNGDTMRMIVSASPVCDQFGRVGGVLLAMQDVTELAALQKHSDNNERHAAVGQMTAGLVHDFNNVLNTITEAVAVLEIDKQRSERDRTILGIIGNAVHSGAQTIRNTRDYLLGSRQKPVLIEVRALLDEVLELTHPILKTHVGVTVVRETQHCGQVKASVDELRRAFTNLVLNALEAMPQGGTLTVRCAQMNHSVVVSVRDTGGGIPPEVQKKIFSPYFTTKAKGTGLGLAGARRAIQAQGGDIRFESVSAKGTTFSVSLPLAEEPAEKTPSAA